MPQTPGSDSSPVRDVDSLLDRLFAALDWRALGAVYCDEGGDAFWAAHCEPALRLGRLWARELGARLPRGGASLYVGAGVAELPAMLTEVRGLGRRVVACNLRREECAAIAAGLRAVGVSDSELDLVCADARDLVSAGPFDHLSLVSVLTDPELWPQSSALGYGRMPPVLLDVDAFVRERDEISSLADALLTALQRPAWITTTSDEVPWLAHGAERRGLAVEADETLIQTAIVGDPIGFLRLT